MIEAVKDDDLSASTPPHFTAAGRRKSLKRIFGEVVEMNSTVYFGIVALLLVGWIVLSYNRLVRARNRKDEGWSGILVQLKRRHDLVPNLAASAKGLAAHERELMENVVKARALSGDASVKQVSRAEGALTEALGRFIALAENYPQIKADAAFKQFMADLSDLEGELQLARRYYNATVRDYNVITQSFPSMVIAKMAGFPPAEFFDLESADESKVPEVKF